MTDNTPLNADDELDLRKWLKNNGWLWEESHVVTPECLDGLQAFLRSDRKKHELEARIDEIEELYTANKSLHADIRTGYTKGLTIRERIAELKAQQEEV